MDVDHRRLHVVVSGELARQDGVAIVLFREVGHGVVAQAMRREAMEEFWVVYLRQRVLVEALVEVSMLDPEEQVTTLRGMEKKARERAISKKCKVEDILRTVTANMK